MNSPASSLPAKTFKERVLHALSFELVGIVICAPVLAWVMDRSVTSMGVLTVMISTVAMLWNMLFNLLFDRLRARLGFNMTLASRTLHAMCFEGGLILFVVPLAAWWLSISLFQAFWLDIGVLLFFLPYTMAFNWAWDGARERLLRNRALQQCN